jgi:hypothetical protein
VSRARAFQRLIRRHGRRVGRGQVIAGRTPMREFVSPPDNRQRRESPLPEPAFEPAGQGLELRLPHPEAPPGHTSPSHWVSDEASQKGALRLCDHPLCRPVAPRAPASGCTRVALSRTRDDLRHTWRTPALQPGSTQGGVGGVRSLLDRDHAGHLRPCHPARGGLLSAPLQWQATRPLVSCDHVRRVRALVRCVRADRERLAAIQAARGGAS